MSDYKTRLLFQKTAFDNVTLDHLSVSTFKANITVGGGTELLNLLPFVGEMDTLIVEIPGYPDPWYLFGESRLIGLSKYSDGEVNVAFRGEQIDRLTKEEFEAWADYQDVSGWKVRFEDATPREKDEIVPNEEEGEE